MAKPKGKVASRRVSQSVRETWIAVVVVVVRGKARDLDSVQTSGCQAQCVYVVVGREESELGRGYRVRSYVLEPLMYLLLSIMNVICSDILSRIEHQRKIVP